MSIQDSPYYIAAVTPSRPELIIDPETVSSIRWGFRRHAMHPHSIFVLMVFEYLVAIFSSIPGPSLLTSVLSLLVLAQFPWAGVNALLWFLFIRKYFPKGTQIKEVIAFRDKAFQAAKVKESLSVI